MDILNEYFINNLNNMYDIANKKTIDSNFMILFLNNFEKMCDKQNFTLENYFENALYNNLTYIHYIIYLILYIPINNNSWYNSSNILFNNRHDINNSIVNNLSYYDIDLNLLNNLYNDTQLINNNYKNDIDKLKNNLYNYTSQLTWLLFTILLRIGNKSLINNIQNPYDYFKKRQELLLKRENSDLKCRTLLLLLTHGTKIVIIQQSYIRRFLARKKIVKIKKNNILNIILYAIPKFIEHNEFICFSGGYNYLKLVNKYATICKKKIDINEYK